MRTLVLLLLLANLTLFAYIKLDSLSTGEGVRLSQQVQPDKITQLTSLQAQGVKTAKVGARAQSVMQTVLVVRDPPAPAVARMRELQGGFPGSEIKIGTCDKTT